MTSIIPPTAGTTKTTTAQRVLQLVRQHGLLRARPDTDRIFADALAAAV